MKKWFLISLLALIIAGLLVSGCGGPATPTAKPAPDKIKIGQAVSLSGVYATNAGFLEVPNIKLWVQEVNAKGGLFLSDYNKRVPIEFTQYDDKSDIDTMVKLVKKLITEDKMDFVLPPHSTAMNFAAVPVLNENKIPHLVFSTIVDQEEMKNMGKYPYRFVIFPDLIHMNTPIVEIAKELGVKTMAVIYIQDSMGIVYNSTMDSMLKNAGISMVLNKSYPLGATDVSTLLKEVKGLNPDALVAFNYPADGVLLTQQSKVIGLNPKMFFVGIGGGMPMYRDTIGGSNIEGVLTWGGWKPSLTAHTQEYFDKFKALNKMEPDFYSSSWAYAYVEVLGQAIEKAGSLDREKVRQVLMTETFKDTVMAVDVKFENYFNQNLWSYVGQWRNSVLESMWPKSNRTVQPIPKPAWQ